MAKQQLIVSERIAKRNSMHLNEIITRVIEKDLDAKDMQLHLDATESQLDNINETILVSAKGKSSVYKFPLSNNPAKSLRNLKEILKGPSRKLRNLKVSLKYSLKFDRNLKRILKI